jgi:hypothetical protein
MFCSRNTTPPGIRSCVPVLRQQRADDVNRVCQHLQIQPVENADTSAASWNRRRSSRPRLAHNSAAAARPIASFSGATATDVFVERHAKQMRLPRRGVRPMPPPAERHLALDEYGPRWPCAPGRDADVAGEALSFFSRSRNARNPRCSSSFNMACSRSVACTAYPHLRAPTCLRATDALLRDLRGIRAGCIRRERIRGQSLSIHATAQDRAATSV